MIINSSKFKSNVLSSLKSINILDLRYEGSESIGLLFRRIGTNFLEEDISSKISPVTIFFSYPTPP